MGGRWPPALAARRRCAAQPQPPNSRTHPCFSFLLPPQVKTKALVGALAAMGCEEGEKVLLICNEANEKLYLSGRNIPTLAINTAHAVQVGLGGRGRWGHWV